MKLPFLGGAYAGRAGQADAQTCINLMVEKDPSAPEADVLVNTPGCAAWGSAIANTGIIRGLLSIPNDGYVYAVSGDRLYRGTLAGPVWTELTSAGHRFTGTTGVTPMVMGTNGDIIVCDQSGNKTYVYDASGPAIKEFNADFGICASGSFTCADLDGYGIVDDRANTGRFYYSANGDYATWNALSFATAGADIDRLYAVITNRRDLYLFGARSIEVWYNAGDANSQFQRFQGGVIQVGTLNANTVKRFDNSIAWLGRNERGECMVYTMDDGYVPRVISTPQINYQLAASAYSTGINDAYAFVYQLAGHEVYCLTLPAVGITWCYDASTKEWHKWRYLGDSGFASMASASKIYDYGGAVFSSLMLAGDNLATGQVYRVAADLYDWNAVAVTRERVTQHVFHQRDRVRIASLELDFEQAVQSSVVQTTTLNGALTAGATTATLTTIGSTAIGNVIVITLASGRYFTAYITNVAGSVVTWTDNELTEDVATLSAVKVYKDDTITLEWSKDGGQNWSTAKRLHLGTAISPKFRTLIRKLGHGRRWTFRIKTTANMKFALKGVYAKLYGEDRDYATGRQASA